MLPKAFRLFTLMMYVFSSAEAALPIVVTAKPQDNQVKNQSLLDTPFVRIKDLAHFTSVRDNPLVGYGLVVGLNGTGDTMSRSTFTRESLTGMLERLGVNIRDGVVPSGKNVAAVMVTANLPAFAQPGTKLDITVSALGDAKELRGGTLLVTPLLGADGNVYAVGQGAVLSSGLQASGKATKEVRGVPTCARVVNGAIVERAMGFQLTSLTSLNLTLHNPDFTTARRVADAINEACGSIAMAADASNVRIKVPEERANQLVAFMTDIEQVKVQPDSAARVIIDANNDVVTLTSTAKIMPVALTHGSITIKVVENPQVYMPASNTNILGASQAVVQNQNSGASNASVTNTDLITALASEQSKERQGIITAQTNAIQAAVDAKKTASQIEQAAAPFKAQLEALEKNHNTALSQLSQNLTADPQGGSQNTSAGGNNGVVQPVVTDKTDVQLKDEIGKFAVVQSGADLQEFVNALNALGVTPKDMMAILQNIKAAGALQADIVLT